MPITHRQSPPPHIVRRGRSLVRLGALLVALAAFAALTVGLYLGYTTRIGATVDLFLPWWALREAIAGGASPYSEEIGMAARAARFGGEPPPLPQHPYHFAYPPYFALFIAPLLPLPYPWAAAAWIALLVVATAWWTLLLCRELRWPATRAGRLLAALGGTLYYPSLISIIVGQITPLVLLLLIAAQMTMRRAGRRQDLLAGAMLAGATVKPQLTWLAVPLLLLDLPSGRRCWTLTGFAATLGGLVTLPLLWLPAWPLEFISSLGGYVTDEPAPSALLILGHLLIGGRLAGTWAGGPAVLAGIGGSSLVMILVTWWWHWRPGRTHLLAAALAVTLAVTPLRAQTAQMALLVPLFWSLRWVATRSDAVAITFGLVALVAGWGVITSRSDPPDFWLRQVLPPIAGIVLACAPAPSSAATRRWPGIARSPSTHHQTG